MLSALHIPFLDPMASQQSMMRLTLFMIVMLSINLMETKGSSKAMFELKDVLKKARDARNRLSEWEKVMPALFVSRVMLFL